MKNHRLDRSPLPHALVLAIATALGAGMAAAPVHASDTGQVQFSEGFLIGGQAIDMQHYVHGDSMAAGVYPLDVLLNDQFLEHRDITFVAVPGSDKAMPCVPLALAQRLGLKDAYLQDVGDHPDACYPLVDRVQGATVAFDGGELQLRIGVPQAAQGRLARGYVAPAQRDHGVTAAFFDYNINHTRAQGQNNSYLSLNTGVNLGAWRLRHRSSYSQGSFGSRHDVISSYLQRDLPRWNSQLLLGQGNTGGELFESVAFTGARVASDERMLPDSLRGFAPVVEGIAEGNAVVSIRQNGNLIHEVTVAPGPFRIEDLYPTNFGGDLEVTVTEADGRAQQFTVNFSAVPQALRPGASRFSATAGELRDTRGLRQALPFAEGAYARGISNHLTALGGVQIAEDFQAALVGGAINTPIGAFGADITHSRARLSNGALASGNSFRLNYQRYVAATGTNFGLAALRYSTEGYLTLGDFAQARSDDWGYGSRARQRFQVNFSQRLGELSTLSLSGGHVSFWDRAPQRTDFQLALHSRVGPANFSLSALRYRLGDGRQDTRYGLNVSVPLGSAPSAPRLSSQLSQAETGRQTQLGINGTLGEDRSLSYSLAASDAENGTRSTSVYGNYQGGHGYLTAGYSKAGDYSALSLGAAGSVVLHRGGVNFGAPVGEGFALVQAEGAQGARVGNGTDLRIGRNGYALLPHVSPYRWNEIELDPSSVSMDVELLHTSQRVAPTAGSIVRVAFSAKRERTLFIDATDALGQPLPFAARVEDSEGRTVGAVGQGGVIQLRGASGQDELLVDPDGPSRCRLQYTTPDAPDAYGLSWSQAVCTPLPPLAPGLQAALDAPAEPAH